MDIEVRALLGRGRSLSLTFATVGGVVTCRIRGGAGNLGRARARRRWHTRASPVPGETEITPEGEPNVRQGGVLRPRADLLFHRIRCPIGGWQATCTHSGACIIMLLRPNVNIVLLPLCSYVTVQVGMRIKCG